MNMLMKSVVALLCLTSTATADPEGIRVFNRVDALAGTHSDEVLTSCAVSGASVEADCLARLAYTYAAATGALELVPQSNRGEESYKDLFLRWNDVDSVTTLSVARYVRKAKGTGFYLPQGAGSVRARDESDWSVVRAELNLLTQQMRALTEGDDESLAEMQARIDILQQDLGGLDATTAGLLGTLQALEEMLKNFANMQVGDRKALQAEITQRLAGFEGRLLTVETKLATKAEQRDLGQLAARVEKLEAAPKAVSDQFVEPASPAATINEWPWWVTALFAFVSLLLIVWVLLFTTRKPKGTEVTNLALELNKPETGVLARLTNVESDVKDLKSGHAYLLQVTTDGLRIKGVPDQEKLNSLKVGEHLDLPIQGAETKKVVRVVRGTLESTDNVFEERIYLYGVRDVNNGLAVEVSTISRCLYKALIDRRLDGIDPQGQDGLAVAAFNRKFRQAAVRRTATK